MMSALDHLKAGETEHCKNGPSSFPAKSRCLHFESDPVPKNDLNHPANRGTLAHIAAADLLTGSGKWPEAVYNELNEFEISGVEWYTSWIEAHAVKGFEAEMRLSLLDDDFNELYFGTADIVWEDSGGNLHVGDLKTGKEKDCLLQLEAYGLAAMEAMDKDRVTLHVFFSQFKKAVKLETISIDDCRGKILTILEDIDEKDKNDPTPCEDCGYCAKATTCKELAEGVTDVVAGYEEAPPFELAEYHSSEIVDPRMMAKALQLAKIVEGWAKSVRHHARKMAVVDGMPIPGYKVQKKRGSVSITDLNEAFQRCGIDPLLFMEACSCSMSKLTPLYHDVCVKLSQDVPEGEEPPKAPTKKATKKQLLELLKDVTTVGKGSSALVVDKKYQGEE